VDQGKERDAKNQHFLNTDQVFDTFTSIIPTYSSHKPLGLGVGTSIPFLQMSKLRLKRGHIN
jgi:hypothetical protein